MSLIINFLALHSLLLIRSAVKAEYTASKYVVWGHILSRNSQFELTSKYYQNVVTLPLVLLSIGIGAFVLIIVAFIFRSCGNCTYGPLKDTAIFENKADRRISLGHTASSIEAANKYIKFITKTNNDRKWYITIGFIVSMVLTLLMIQGLVGSNEHFLVPTSLAVSKDISNINQIFTKLTIQTDSLSLYTSYISSNTSSIELKCPKSSKIVSSMKTSINTANEYIDDFSQISSKMNDKVQKFNDYYHNNFLKYYQGTYCPIYWLYGLTILSLIVFGLSYYFKSITTSRVAIGYALCIYILIVSLNTIWILVTSILSDFCVKPVSNLISIVPNAIITSDVSLRNVTSYYLTCTGTDVFANYISQGSTATNSLSSSLGYVTSLNCPNTTIVNVNHINQTISTINSKYQEIESSIDCVTMIHPILSSLVFDSVCVNLVNGFALIWFSQAFVAIFLFLCVILCSWGYQYYRLDNIIHALVPSQDNQLPQYPHSAMVGVMTRGNSKANDRRGSGVVVPFDREYP